MKHCKNNDNKRENKVRNHRFLIFYKTIGLLSTSLFFENACTLLPAGVVLVLEPLVADFKRVEGPDGLTGKVTLSLSNKKIPLSIYICSVFFTIFERFCRAEGREN